MSLNGSTQKNEEARSLSVAPISGRREAPHAGKVSKTIQSMSSVKPANQQMQDTPPDQSIAAPDPLTTPCSIRNCHTSSTEASMNMIDDARIFLLPGMDGMPSPGGREERCVVAESAFPHSRRAAGSAAGGRREMRAMWLVLPRGHSPIRMRAGDLQWARWAVERSRTLQH